jgi:hypothetical protein
VGCSDVEAQDKRSGFIVRSCALVDVSPIHQFLTALPPMTAIFVKTTQSF